VLVLFLAWISGLEALTPAKIIGMGLSFAGIAMLATQHAADSHSAALVGDLLALAGTIGFAVFAVLGKRVANRYDTVAINTVSQLTGALLVLPLAAHQAVRLDWRRVTWPGWEGLACTVVFGSIVGYVVFFVLLDHLSATQVILLNYLQPIVAAALGVALLHEKMGAEFLLAAVLVLAGVGLAEGARGRPAPIG
jgi:drug/metabolite transporter (DMT)-like permease